jgi:hypothetical protein
VRFTRADETRHDLRRTHPVVALDQCPTRRGEADGREERSPPVDRLLRIGARLGHVPERDDDRDDRDRDVHQEHPSPRERVDEPTAEERADRARDPRETRPRADGASAIGVVERRADDRETAGNQQGARRALRAAGNGEHDGVGREAARDARGRERRQARDEHPPAPEAIAQRAA